MNPSQIHLALTHVPVILAFVALAVMLVAMFSKNNTLVKTSFYILVAAGLFSIPVFFSGEGAEEVIEHLPGVSENTIEEHEDSAKLAFMLVLASGLAAAIGLFVNRKPSVSKIMVPLVFILTIATAAVITRAAHLGGQIRHSEIRSNQQPPAAGDITYDDTWDDD